MAELHGLGRRGLVKKSFLVHKAFRVFDSSAAKMPFPAQTDVSFWQKNVSFLQFLLIFLLWSSGPENPREPGYGQGLHCAARPRAAGRIRRPGAGRGLSALPASFTPKYLPILSPNKHIKNVTIRIIIAHIIAFTIE